MHCHGHLSIGPEQLMCVLYIFNTYVRGCVWFIIHVPRFDLNILSGPMKETIGMTASREQSINKMMIMMSMKATRNREWTVINVPEKEDFIYVCVWDVGRDDSKLCSEYQWNGRMVVRCPICFASYDISSAVGAWMNVLQWIFHRTGFPFVSHPIRKEPIYSMAIFGATNFRTKSMCFNDYRYFVFVSLHSPFFHFWLSIIHQLLSKFAPVLFR